MRRIEFKGSRGMPGALKGGDPQNACPKALGLVVTRAKAAAGRTRDRFTGAESVDGEWASATGKVSCPRAQHPSWPCVQF